MEREERDARDTPDPPDPWEADYSAAQAAEPFAPESRRESPPAIRYVTGFTGALAGALVGAIPWFLASAFTGFFVGYLGFLVGWAACRGYRLAKGARRTGYAMTVIALCSVLSLIGSDLASNLYALCVLPDWQETAALYGISVQRLALESLLLRENWQYILPNLGVGLLVGGLGIFSARGQVLAYTVPDRAERKAPAGAAPAQPGDAVSTGLRLPGQFTLRESRGVLALGILCTVLFGSLFLVSLFVMQFPEEFGYVLIGAVLTLLGVWVLLDGALRRLEVDGEQLRYVSSFGRATEFSAADIAGVSLGDTVRLRGREGRVLARFERNMKNAPLLIQYLSQHNVPLRG